MKIDRSLCLAKEVDRHEVQLSGIEYPLSWIACIDSARKCIPYAMAYLCSKKMKWRGLIQYQQIF